MRNPFSRRCNCPMCRLTRQVEKMGWTIVTPNQAIDADHGLMYGAIIGAPDFVEYVLSELDE